MSRVLIVAEHNGQQLNPSTAKCVTAARSIEGVQAIDVVVLGSGIDAIAQQAASIDGVTKVRGIDSDANVAPLAAIFAPQIAEIAGDYSHIFGPSTTFGKDLMPRLAARLGVGQLSDVMAIESSHVFKRPIYAGNAIITVEAPADSIVVATIRTASYQATGDGGSAEIEAVSPTTALPSHTRFVELKSASSDRPDLQTAAQVVSGGRALASSENFELLYTLADTLGAAVGASRAAVDAGYVPNDMQVGQTGKIIAPDLYIAIGISGAIQHLTGIKDAGTIVAINKDEEAPIFEVADVGLVGDLFKVVPELTELLK